MWLKWIGAKNPLFRNLAFAPAGDPPAGDPPAGDPPAGDPPAGDPPAGDPPAGDPPAGDPPGGAKWWENPKAFDDGARQQLTALGLTVDDPNEAISKLLGMEAAAKRKFGDSPQNLISKPKEGQSQAEWMKEHADIFGIPEAADKYEVAKPEAWPKDAPWDDGLEGKAREAALKHGLSGDALQDFVGIYADAVMGMEAQAQEDLKVANDQMMADLRKDWGDQTAAKMAMAQQAAQAIAADAGLDQDAQMGLFSVLSEKTGNAGVLKVFASIAPLLGEDMMVNPGVGGGAGQETPAEARQKLNQMMQPDSDWSKAVAEKRSSGNSAKYDELAPIYSRLNKIASQR
jgi:hypothetical protein